MCGMAPAATFYRAFNHVANIALRKAKHKSLGNQLDSSVAIIDTGEKEVSSGN